MLNKKSSKISVIEIIEALDGPISLTACVESSEDMCEASNICFLGGKWNKVNEIIRKSLNDISLENLLNYEDTFPINNKKDTELRAIN
jgi:DNA-binding IscR family transcriptional regulator